jgi:hypothetical protein
VSFCLLCVFRLICAFSSNAIAIAGVQMAVGICSVCGKGGFAGEGICLACRDRIDWAEARRMYGEMASDVNAITYQCVRDGGSCGCNTRKRRLFFLCFAPVLTIVAFITPGPDGNPHDFLHYLQDPLRWVYALAVFVTWTLIAMCCPNTPCGILAADGRPGVVTKEELKQYVVCVPQELAPQHGRTAPLLAGQEPSQV